MNAKTWIYAGVASSKRLSPSTYRTPFTRYQDPTPHILDQRYSLVHRITPTLHSPAHLPPCLALLQVRKLPQVMDRVDIANLHEPCPDSFHYFASRSQSLAPVRLPLQKISGVQVIGAQLKEATQPAWRGCRPEREFLHERRFFARDEGFERPVKGGKVGMRGNGVEGGVVALVALVLPDVDWLMLAQPSSMLC